MKAIVSANWLHEKISYEDLVILDASLASTVDGTAIDSGEKTIPGARYFDLKGCFSDKASPFPNTVPSAQQFQSECRKLGINSTSRIVVFDNAGIYSSPRVWWMFRAMGHAQIAVLDGGLPAWMAEGLPMEEKNTRTFSPGNFKATFQKQYVKSYNDVVKNVTEPSFVIMDARSKGRFNGTEEEPRKSLKSGHIPGSINVPYKEVLNNGKLKSTEELQSLFRAHEATSKELVFSCGSGLTACIIMLAHELSMGNNKRLYDGSWTEWAELQHLKVDERI